MASSRRLITLDIIRGFLLVVIFIDHLFRFPSIFAFITGQGQLWVSAAEGFFIISGMLVGYLNLSAKKLLSRALKLYLLSICLTLIFTIVGRYFPLDKIKTGLWLGTDFSNLLYQTIFMKYIYGWTDFLIYYSVFMFFAPLAKLIVTKTGSLLLSVMSLLCWFFFHLHNSFAAWQLLFFSGMIIGANLSGYEQFLKKFQSILKPLTVISLLLSIIFVFILKIDLLPFWFDKNTVGLGRFLLSWLWFSTLFFLVRQNETIIQQRTFDFFEGLGRNSLYVYCLEGFLLFPVNFFVQYQFGYIGNSLFTLAAIALIFYLTSHQKQITNTLGHTSQLAFQYARVIILALLTGI